MDITFAIPKLKRRGDKAMLLYTVRIESVTSAEGLTSKRGFKHQKLHDEN